MSAIFTAAAQNETLFRQALDRLPAAAYTCDADGLITYFNEQALRVWGRAPKLNDPDDRFCGSFRLFALDGRPIHHDDCWMALAIRHRQEYLAHEIVIERPDYSRVTVLAYATPIRNAAGSVVGAVNLLVNISDRKRIDTLLEEADRTNSFYRAAVACALRDELEPLKATVATLEAASNGDPSIDAVVKQLKIQLAQVSSLANEMVELESQGQAPKPPHPHIEMESSHGLGSF